MGPQQSWQPGMQANVGMRDRKNLIFCMLPVTALPLQTSTLNRLSVRYLTSPETSPPAASRLLHDGDKERGRS